MPDCRYKFWCDAYHPGLCPLTGAKGCFKGKSKILKAGGFPVELKRLVMPDPAQMCCYMCGHIAAIDDSYEIDQTCDDGEEFAICPKCGEDNCGGNPSYAIADVWPEEMLLQIVEKNQEA